MALAVASLDLHKGKAIEHCLQRPDFSPHMMNVGERHSLSDEFCSIQIWLDCRTRDVIPGLKSKASRGPQHGVASLPGVSHGNQN